MRLTKLCYLLLNYYWTQRDYDIRVGTWEKTLYLYYDAVKEWGQQHKWHFDEAWISKIYFIHFLNILLLIRTIDWKTSDQNFIQKIQ